VQNPLKSFVVKDFKRNRGEIEGFDFQIRKPKKEQV
jgi:hypothetical protein